MNFNVSIPVSFFKEGNVKKRFEQVVDVFFEELVDMGTLDDVLANLGWTKTQSKWTPPFQVGHGLQRVSLPLSA